MAKNITDEERKRLAKQGFINRVTDVETPIIVNPELNKEQQKLIDRIKNIAKENNLTEDEVISKFVDFTKNQKQINDASLRPKEDVLEFKESEITLIVDIMNKANSQSQTSETLKETQNKVIEVINKQNLGDSKLVNKYLESQAAQDRQEIMQNDKLPFKDKIYSVVKKLSEACHISKLSNYCQKKLDEHAKQRQKNNVKVDKGSHVAKLGQSRSNSQSSSMAKS